MDEDKKHDIKQNPDSSSAQLPLAGADKPYAAPPLAPVESQEPPVPDDEDDDISLPLSARRENAAAQLQETAPADDTDEDTDD
ncbi:MAG: hypothetical protein HP052_03660, partial [Firmicutes bacterium]|nr:hypothetical protein [Bacillota bacterium]